MISKLESVQPVIVLALFSLSHLSIAILIWSPLVFCPFVPIFALLLQLLVSRRLWAIVFCIAVTSKRGMMYAMRGQFISFHLSIEFSTYLSPWRSPISCNSPTFENLYLSNQSFIHLYRAMSRCGPLGAYTTLAISARKGLVECGRPNRELSDHSTSHRFWYPWSTT